MASIAINRITTFPPSAVQQRGNILCTASIRTEQRCRRYTHNPIPNQRDFVSFDLTTQRSNDGGRPQGVRLLASHAQSYKPVAPIDLDTLDRLPHEFQQLPPRTTCRSPATKRSSPVQTGRNDVDFRSGRDYRQALRPIFAGDAAPPRLSVTTRLGCFVNYAGTPI